MIHGIAKELSTGIGATLLKEIPFHDRMEVMDFGAGTGLICSHVAPLVKKITAVEISESMLDKLMSKQEIQGKVKTVCQNIMETPLDEKFDLIMSAFALHHVKDTDRLIQSLANHLKPGASIEGTTQIRAEMHAKKFFCSRRSAVLILPRFP